MLGFLMQWPTILTLVMLPVLVWMCVHLARREEQDIEEFADAYRQHARQTTAFVPRLR